MKDSSKLRSISWFELFPWLIIFRSFRVSLGMTAMLAALLGALLTPIGWKISSTLFLGEERLRDNLLLKVIAEDLESIRPPHSDSQPDIPALRPSEAGIPPAASSDWSLTFRRYTEPAASIFRLNREYSLGKEDISLTEFAYLIFGTLWSLVVWAFCGGVIVRRSIVKLSVDERLSIKQTISHTTGKYLSYLCAPLFPLIAVVLIAFPIALVGLLMRAGDVGALIAGLLWIFVLIGGGIMAITLLGLLFGWPLMWGAIAAEKHSDTFDAVSRAYSYVFQRPLHYLFYALLASLFGALCWILVDAFSTAVIDLSWWAASFGAGDERVDYLRYAAEGRERQLGLTKIWAYVFAIVEGVVYLLVSAFRYSFFWTASAAMYLLLRYDADRTEIDEVYLEDDEQLNQLPTLPTDDRGVPKAPEEVDDEDK